MQEKLEFSQLKSSDILDILKIEKSSFPNPWTREMFERELGLAISRFYIAKADLKVIGYCGFWIVEDEAHILTLAVSQEERNKGYGRKIVEYMLEKIKESRLKKVLLEVRESNTDARKLYIKLGFKETGRREKYYGDETAVLMDLML